MTEGAKKDDRPKIVFNEFETRHARIRRGEKSCRDLRKDLQDKER
jgi:hypothetical protein